MKERPILFSAAMVNAILAGEKTQTRRVVKFQPPSDDFILSRMIESTARADRKKEGKLHWIKVKNDIEIVDSDDNYFTCPYGQPGDHLWVREAFRFDTNVKEETITYKADGVVHHVQDNAGVLIEQDFGKWKPSIHMHRWASRLTLEIINIRVERLQDISGIDALAEGIRCASKFDNADITDYANLWDSINGKKHPWDSNPWVWVIEFRRIA